MAKHTASHPFELIGVGNPIMDLLAHVDDAFLKQHVAGDKGGMVLVDDEDIVGLLHHIGDRIAMMPGGSAANTTLGATKLGLKTTFLGKIGGDITAGHYYENFVAAGGDGYPALKQHPGYVDSGFTDADVLRAHIAAHSPLRAADYEPDDAVIRR